MRLLVLACMIAAAAAGSLRSYGLPSPGPGDSGIFGNGCANGQIRHVDGNCVTPLVTRNLYLYNAPPVDPIVGPRPIVPPPRIEQTLLFIRTPEVGPGPDPIIVPPPQTKNVVYVLNQRPEVEQKVVLVPAPEQQTPQVYFVNYAEGDNPNLPTGDDLQSALSAAAHGSGEVIGALGGTGGEFGIGLGSVGGGNGVDLSDSSLGVSTPSGLYSPP
nr:uncharacterized protein LOC128685406 [Cherax quadricarinatus]